MLVSQLRHYGQNMRHSVLAIGNSNVYHVVNGINRKSYSKENGECCKNVSQTEGKRVEEWPKAATAGAWRCECPRDPPPVNNDPYRIKVPDIVVPPLPPSNAKELPREDSNQMFNEPMFNFDHAGVGQCKAVLQNSIVHPEFWKNKKETKANSVKEVLPKLGYHGRNKYKFAFHEPWKPLDRITLLDQAEKEDICRAEDEATSK